MRNLIINQAKLFNTYAIGVQDATLAFLSASDLPKLSEEIDCSVAFFCNRNEATLRVYNRAIFDETLTILRNWLGLDPPAEENTARIRHEFVTDDFTILLYFWK